VRPAMLTVRIPHCWSRGLRHPTLAMVLRLADALHLEPGMLVTNTVARLRAAECVRSSEPSSTSKHSEKEFTSC
jgi:hypothetical protein